MDRIDAAAIEEYKSWRLTHRSKRKGSVAKATINKELNTISSMFRIAQDHGYVPHIPKIKRFTIEKKQPRFLTTDEICKLLAAASPWARTIITFGINTGLRHSEILALRLEDVNWQERSLTVQKSKSGRARVIDLSEECYALLQTLATQYMEPDSGELIPRPSSYPYVFCNKNGKKITTILRTVKKAAMRAEITGITPHILRHTFASHLAMSGVDIVTIRDYLGHASLSTTQIYSHVSRAHKRNAIHKLSYGRKPAQVVPIAVNANARGENRGKDESKTKNGNSRSPVSPRLHSSTNWRSQRDSNPCLSLERAMS
jgi:integrase